MFFKGKNVLIVGGTGTIGQSLLRLVLTEEPTRVRVFSRDEYKQFRLQTALGKLANVVYMLGDVRNADRVSEAMEGIDYVFHAAALKHVYACEANPSEAVYTNIVGTQNVVKAAHEHRVQKVVFTSSDKAISPTNAYGATKLIAERIVAASYAKERSTAIAIVRFGNVIGSRGSVIPLFLEQLRRNRILTVTDPDMSRFMMTLRQATALTVNALKASGGGEVFVLKMPVIRIGDLTQAVVDEACAKFGIDPATVGIRTIGMKPGEKKYEELMTEEESEFAYETDEMFIIPPKADRKRKYEGARKAKRGMYGSDRVAPIRLEQIKQLLHQELMI